ncbi:MAG: AAA family ATPase [Methanobacterium sp.]|nr:AAA family ATPase [Methanobacterium sp.]
MTPRKKKEHALGKGLDALIRADYLDEDEKPESTVEKESRTEKLMSKESVKEKETPEKKELNKDVTEKSEPILVDQKIVEDVLLEVHRNPRISLWSAKSAAVLRFLKKTKPEFSISNEASLLIEEAVKERHPDIWELFEEKGL